jgi:hypothetical protein
MSALSPSHRRHPDAGGAGPRVFVALAFTLGVLVAPACRPVAIPPGGEFPTAEGTLAGTVRGPEGIAPPPGRQVEAVNVDTEARYATETGVTGGFSVMVPPGRYRIEVTLVPGEEVIRDPGVVAVESGGLADGKDVVLGGAGVFGQD